LTERRAYTRVESDLEAVWEQAGESTTVVLRDLTLEGALMYGDARAENGDEAKLTISGGEGPVQVWAQVVRVEGDGKKRGLGVRFVRVTLEARRALANHLLSRAVPGARKS
jgi:hypothetical protein